MGWIVSLLFFYKDVCGIKYLTKVVMQLNKETKHTKETIFVEKEQISKVGDCRQGRPKCFFFISYETEG